MLHKAQSVIAVLVCYCAGLHDKILLKSKKNQYAIKCSHQAGIMIARVITQQSQSEELLDFLMGSKWIHGAETQPD